MTPWTVALQAPLSMEFSRQEHWSGLLCPPPEALPDPGWSSKFCCSSRFPADTSTCYPHIKMGSKKRGLLWASVTLNHTHYPLFLPLCVLFPLPSLVSFSSLSHVPFPSNNSTHLSEVNTKSLWTQKTSLTTPSPQVDGSAFYSYSHTTLQTYTASEHWSHCLSVGASPSRKNTLGTGPLASLWT